MQTFTNILDFVINFESFSRAPYFATSDEKVRGIMTIGYGQTYPVESCPASMTEDEALKLIQHRLEDISDLIKSFNRNLMQCEIDALCSLFYNAGLGGKPNLITDLKQKNLLGSALEFLNVIYQDGIPMKGLILRRCSEYDMFMKGLYQRLDMINPIHQSLLLKMNAHNQAAIELIESLPTGEQK